MSANFTRKPFQCVTCQVGFSTKGNWTVHNRRYHAYQPIVNQCWICGITFENWIDLSQHRRIHTPSGTFVERQRALHGAARSFEYDFSEDSAESDIYKVASDLRSKLKQLLRVLLSEGPHKISIVVITECVKANEDGEIEDKLDVPFRAPSFMGRIEDDLDHDLASSFDIVAAKMDNFHQDGSCWKMDRVLSVRVEVTLCRPLSGSCHLDVVSTPNDLKRTSCIPLNSRPCHDCFYRAIATYFVHGQKMEPSDIQCFIEKHVKKLHAKDVAVALQVQ